MTYAINEAYMSKLQEKMTKVQNKCNKYGCSFLYREVGEEFRTKEITENDIKTTITQRFVIVEAEGIARVNGWEFIATLEHKEAGNIIRAFNTTVEIPEAYYTVAPKCDHCKSLRTRKDTYLIKNENGSFLQVGRSCLRDFTNNALSAEAIADFMSYFDELDKSDGCFASNGVKYVERDRFLCVVHEIVKLFGYRNSASAMEFGCPSTLSRATAAYRNEKIQMKELANLDYTPESEEAKADVKAALEWILASEEKSGYLWNLKVTASTEFVSYRDIGILGSLLTAYFKHLEREEERIAREAAKAARQENPSQHIAGNVGDRIDLTVSEVILLATFSNEFGITYVYKMISEGNTLIWKTGAILDKGSIKAVRGTIKEFSEFRGEKQTVLTRCKVS